MILKVLLMVILPLGHAVLGEFLKNRSMPIVCGEKAGCMRGRLMQGYTIPSFEAFLGIPYALPPVNDLRFISPIEYPKFMSIFDAHEVTADCIQKNYLLPSYPVSGSEDCLYLNVYRPRHPKLQKFPVMIYIYGGGFFSGSANPAVTGPEYIMDTEQVILVTFSYRLGPFGFLSTGDDVIPGNFGLKDQLLAIKWVHNNIEAFGGNPAKVTLFGQSAGAVSAHMHMLSPQSQDLFQGVIALSGTANVPFAITEKPLEQAIRVAKLCDIENAEDLTTNDLLEALKSVSHDKLLRAGDGLKFWSVDHLTNFRPVVEAENVTDAFLTRHPVEILQSGNYKQVPFMLGTVPHEGAVRGLAIVESPHLRESFNKDFMNLLQTFLEFPDYMNDPQQLNDKMQKIIQEYFKGVEELNNNTRQGFVDLITHRGFYHPLYHAMKYHLRTNAKKAFPMYLYSFNYTGPYSYATLYTGKLSKNHSAVVHCDDLIYLFRSPLLFKDFAKNSQHSKAMQLFVRNFVHFAQFQMPLSRISLKPCDISTFVRCPDRICNYQLFANGYTDEASIRLKVDNKFNIKAVKFWDKILNK